MSSGRRKSRLLADNWYETVQDETVEQGEILVDCPVLIPTVELLDATPGETISARVEKHELIVLSQSCDLEQNRVPLVAVCSVYGLSDLGDVDPKFATRNAKKNLERNRLVGLYLLEPTVIRGKEDHLVVDFRSVLGLPLSFLKQFVHGMERQRLRSPYREHLAQAFGTFFARVALPRGIKPLQ